MASGVRIENLWKVFSAKTVALREINIEISPGEFFVILGPSGSGKTTLLRIIAGLEIPTKGRVVIGNSEVVNVEKGVFVEPRDRNIGMVFQNWALYPHMTAYKNVAFPLELKGLPRDEIDKRVKEVAEALGILELLDRKPSQMSGGQQQRIAIARALVKQPEVLLLDEPFSNLDARIRIAAREFVKELQKRLGITAILVTHDQADAFAVGDRIVVLKDGVVQQIGTPEELYNRPENLFIASFIGDPPMNIFQINAGDPILRGLGLNIGEGHGEVFVGIRPDEAMALGRKEEGHLVGRAKLVEYLGSRRYARVELSNGISLKVLASQDVSREGEVGIAVKRLYVFAPDGRRIDVINMS